MDKKKRITLLVSLILIILVSIVIKNTDFRSYTGMNIDEVVSRRYRDYSCSYIESNSYYLILGENDNGDYIKEIAYQDENGCYNFNLTYKFSKMLILKNNEGFNLYFLKNEDAFVFYIWPGSSNITFYDNEEIWPYIEYENSELSGYWFIVKDKLDSDFSITFSVDGTETTLITYDEIYAKFKLSE